MHLLVVTGCKTKDAGLYSASLANHVTSGAALRVKEATADFRVEIKDGDGVQGGGYVFRCHLTKKNAHLKWMRFGQVRHGISYVSNMPFYHSKIVDPLSLSLSLTYTHIRCYYLKK